MNARTTRSKRWYECDECKTRFEVGSNELHRSKRTTCTGCGSARVELASVVKQRRMDEAAQVDKEKEKNKSTAID